MIRSILAGVVLAALAVQFVIDGVRAVWRERAAAECIDNLLD